MGSRARHGSGGCQSGRSVTTQACNAFVSSKADDTVVGRGRAITDTLCRAQITRINASDANFDIGQVFQLPCTSASVTVASAVVLSAMAVM